MEGSPKQKRPVFQPYIPVHRRNKLEQSVAQTPTTRIVTRDDIDTSKRRGRGQFRAPSTEDNVTISISSSDNSESTEISACSINSSKDVKSFGENEYHTSGILNRKSISISIHRKK
jgi:hypothetical protein